MNWTKLRLVFCIAATEEVAQPIDQVLRGSYMETDYHHL